jgi:hypothetical protein
MSSEYTNNAAMAYVQNPQPCADEFYVDIELRPINGLGNLRGGNREGKDGAGWGEFWRGVCACLPHAFGGRRV